MPASPRESIGTFFTVNGIVIIASSNRIVTRTARYMICLISAKNQIIIIRKQSRGIRDCGWYEVYNNSRNIVISLQIQAYGSSVPINHSSFNKGLPLIKTIQMYVLHPDTCYFSKIFNLNFYCCSFI